MRLIAFTIALVVLFVLSTRDATLSIFRDAWSHGGECGKTALSRLFMRRPLEQASSSQVALQDSSILTAVTCARPQIRKEWRALADSEKEAWISAVKCLTETPCMKKANSQQAGNSNMRNESGSWYDGEYFSYVHMELNDKIHQTGLFLPWHRYFLWSFETTLRDLCGYTGVSPYWDWTIDAPDFAHGTIFGDSDPRKGLGGFGVAALDGVVVDGAFARMHLTYPSSHLLRRQYTPRPYANMSTRWTKDPNILAVTKFTRQEVDKMVNGFVGDFKSFQGYLEGTDGAHMSAHLIIGGDLGGTCPKGETACLPDAKWSPNEPIFWMHHGMVDKVWYDWQHAHSENFWALDAGVVRDLETWPRFVNGAPPTLTMNFPLPTKDILFGNYNVGHFFNTTSGDPLCYVYQ